MTAEQKPEVVYTTKHRNRTIRVKCKGGVYFDELTGYKYTDNGRTYFGTIEHGYVERSHFDFAIRPNADTLEDSNMLVLRKLKRTFA